MKTLSAPLIDFTGKYMKLGTTNVVVRHLSLLRAEFRSETLVPQGSDGVEFWNPDF